VYIERDKNFGVSDAVTLHMNDRRSALSDPINARLMQDFERMQSVPMSERDPKYLVSTLGLSAVGDVAIDLPDANVLIQVGGLGGGRRQEAQRMGRILRKKTGEDQEAMFYTLISRDTTEVRFGQHRQQYLIDQGYNYRVLLANELLSGWSSSTVPEGSPAEREMLEATLENIHDGSRGGSSHKKAGGSTGGRGQRGGRFGRSESRQQEEARQREIAATRYTQPGRYYLTKFKAKKRKIASDNASAARKAAAEEVAEAAWGGFIDYYEGGVTHS